MSVNLPSCVNLIGSVFQEISGPGTIEINTPLAAPYGGTSGDENVFLLTAGQTIEITLPSSEEFDPDIVNVQASNSVTLILV